ncbi:hypothetical protein D6D10_09269 [Aureobasidium pullulans]|uniref:F-box domain-containing protein n=1 Tax=Aureobasidium pullulans TaxID=5580 RepID=A0A4S9E2T5_AURPU|nr:hypothetical protein D6D10_09269 [Aureobasidium pullulans]
MPPNLQDLGIEDSLADMPIDALMDSMRSGDEDQINNSMQELFSAVANMEFPKSEEEKLADSLLQQCRKEGICFCKDGELPKGHKKRCRALERLIQQSEDARNRYSDWSLVDLKTELKQRQIPLPKPKRRSKAAITKLLQQSDSQMPFRLMDLPSEVRLRIYEHMLVDSSKQDISPSCGIETRRPSLLRTSRQVRDEAMPVFYGANRFRFALPHLKLGHKCKQWFAGRDKIWLDVIGPDNIKLLRRISFRLMSPFFEEFDLHIDLASRSVNTWVIPVSSGRYLCPCTSLEKRTLMQWREHMSNEVKPEAKEEFFSYIDKLSETAKQAIQDFQALCGGGKEVQPTAAGLDILARAAHAILDHRASWVAYCTDLGGHMEFGSDEDEEDDGEDEDDEEDEV